MKARGLGFAWAIALGCLGTGCSEYHVEIEADVQPPVEMQIAEDSVTIQDGLAGTVVVHPFRNDNRMDVDCEIEVESLDQDIVTARQTDPSIYDGSINSSWATRLDAHRIGTAEILVTINGSDDVIFVVDVVEQVYDVAEDGS